MEGLLKALLKILKWTVIVTLAFSFVLLLIGYYNVTFVPKDMLEKAYEGQPYDVIIVPGVPYEAEGHWSKIMKARVLWSKFLYDEGITRNIIYSGSAVYTPYIEAEIMKLYGEALGIPSDNIYTESDAEHSTENLFYAYNLAKESGFTSIALATDPLQSMMLTPLRKKLDQKIGSIPICFKKLEAMPQTDFDIDPGKAYVEDFISIIEREGLWERLKGTFGKKVFLDESSQ